MVTKYSFTIFNIYYLHSVFCTCRYLYSWLLFSPSDFRWVCITYWVLVCCVVFIQIKILSSFEFWVSNIKCIRLWDLSSIGVFSFHWTFQFSTSNWVWSEFSKFLKTSTCVHILSCFLKAGFLCLIFGFVLKVQFRKS